ncbi:MAG: hypothetical protein AAGG45_09410 [Pseudomonadota bacterium]
MPAPEGKSAKSDQPGLDDLLEDVFGLSLRAGTTLSHLLTKPAQIAAAARSPSFKDTYTPTIRLTFSLLTLMMLLSFFWAGENSPFFELLRNIVESSAPEGTPDPVIDSLAKDFFAKYSVVYPVIYLIFQGTVGSLVFVWGNGTPLVARLRLYFSILAIGMLWALISIGFVAMTNLEMNTTYLISALLITFLIYSLFYSFLIEGTHSGSAKIWRAVLIAIIVLIADNAISTLSAVTAGYWSALEAATNT